MRSKQTTAFTLVEMLAVLLLVGLMLTLTIPAVTKLLKSGGVTGGARAVANTLSLARQYAISHRVNTLVIFPTSGNLMTNYYYVSFAVVARNANNTAWVPLGRVETLPTGVVFPPTITTTLPLTNSILTPFNNTTIDNVPYILFRPTGLPVVYDPTSPTTTTGRVSVCEGFIDPTAFLPQLTSNNRADIVFDSLVGRIRINR
jgi:competence protein ComGC